MKPLPRVHSRIWFEEKGNIYDIFVFLWGVLLKSKIKRLNIKNNLGGGCQNEEKSFFLRTSLSRWPCTSFIWRSFTYQKLHHELHLLTKVIFSLWWTEQLTFIWANSKKSLVKHNSIIFQAGKQLNLIQLLKIQFCNVPHIEISTGIKL